MRKLILWIASALLAIPAIGMFTGGAVTSMDHLWGVVFAVGAIIFWYHAAHK
jgi:hypothetical protein